MNQRVALAHDNGDLFYCITYPVECISSFSLPYHLFGGVLTNYGFNIEISYRVKSKINISHKTHRELKTCGLLHFFGSKYQASNKREWRPLQNLICDNILFSIYYPHRVIKGKIHWTDWV